MPDTSQVTESQYVDPAMVEVSKTKKAVVLDGGEIQQDKWKNIRLQNVCVQLDGNSKKLSPTKSSTQTLQRAWGMNSDSWVGKVIDLSTAMENGRLVVVCKPSNLTKYTEEEVQA